MLVLPKLIYRLNATPVKQNPSRLFCEYRKTKSKVYIERHKTENIQCSTEGGQSWRTDTTDFKTYYKASVIKTVR